MRASFAGWALTLGFLVLGCSASSSESKGNPFGGSGGSGASGNGSGASSGANGSGSTLGAGGDSPIINVDSGSNNGGPDASECPRVVSKPEQIIQYHDATVTDTIITYSPIAIYIMQDRSSSMVGVLGDASSWPNSQAAVGAFVDDPASDGLYVGLGAFPPYPSNDGSSNCTANCDTPIVPIAALPGNAPQIKNAYTQADPSTSAFLVNLTPTECGLNGMIDACAAFEAQMQAAGTPMDCVGLLVTDGNPTECNLDTAYLSSMLANALAATGMKTFVVGLPGANLATLNQFAVAGGTGQAIDLTQGTTVQAIQGALNTVRDAVATKVSSQVTTQTVLETKLPCDWNVPSTIDPKKTNLEFTVGGSTEQFGHVQDASACDAATTDAWYYDNNTTPTKVSVCPKTCDKIKAATSPLVNLIFGCDTVEAPVQ